MKIWRLTVVAFALLSLVFALGAEASYEKPHVVSYQTTETAGTIIIFTAERHLYLIQDNSTALQYSIAVGRQGTQWSGRKVIARKAEWPSWTPTARMIAHNRKKYGRWARGMRGGPHNPLGARALYLANSMYRIHGTNEPNSIGRAVSSGCIRMQNADVIDLYGRVGIGTLVVVRKW